MRNTILILSIAAFAFASGMFVQQRYYASTPVIVHNVMFQSCYLEDNYWPQGLDADLGNLKEVYEGMKARKDSLRQVRDSIATSK